MSSDDNLYWTNRITQAVRDGKDIYGLIGRIRSLYYHLGKADGREAAYSDLQNDIGDRRTRASAQRASVRQELDEEQKNA